MGRAALAAEGRSGGWIAMIDFAICIHSTACFAQAWRALVRCISPSALVAEVNSAFASIRGADAGKKSNRAAPSGRLQGGREEVFFTGEQDLPEWRQDRARPAGRGDGARHLRERQGQARGCARLRQQEQHRLLHCLRTPSLRHLRCPPLAPVPHTRRCRPLWSRDSLCRSAPALTA